MGPTNCIKNALRCLVVMKIACNNAMFCGNVSSMTQSTITDKFQTTIPLEVRQALKLSPRQRISYELRPDGSAILRPVPGLDELYGSVRLGRRAASAGEEKQAAREAMAKDAGKE